MSQTDKSVKQLMEITGLDELKAASVLEINNYNIEQAINYHLENIDEVKLANNDMTYSSLSNVEFLSSCNLKKNDESDLRNTDNSFMSENASLPEINCKPAFKNINENVRAPIPTKREQLLLPDEDQFRLHYSSEANRKRRIVTNGFFTLCPFRDFAREAQIQEELSEKFTNLAYSSIESQSYSFPSTCSYSSTTSTENLNECGVENNQKKKNLVKRSNEYNINQINTDETETDFRIPKRKRLEDLFRPPLDLLYWGTFQSARDHATSLNRWLIVNLQDQREFKSQILNRDVWSDKDIKEIISSNFVLWQVAIESPEGLRFKTFYHVSSCPYVCVIDPRTGEEKLTCDSTKPKILHNDFVKFLTQYFFCLDISFKMAKTMLAEASTTATSNNISRIMPSSALNSKTEVNSSNFLLKKKCESFHNLELTEEEQLELAIKNSLNETLSESNNLIERTKCDDINMWKNVDNFHFEKTNNLIDLNCNKNKERDFKYKETKSFNGIKSKIISKLGREVTEHNKDPITKIQIRLPCGEREELEWPCSSELKKLKIYISKNYPEITKSAYKIIQSYPRINILEIDENISLLDAKLHPTSILYLHTDD